MEPRVDTRWRVDECLRDTDWFLERYAALPSAVTQARHALECWLEDAGAGDRRLEDVRLAVSEAVTNVVMHAYGGPSRDGTFELAGSLAHHRGLWIVVSDAGSGFRAHGNTGGLGLGLSLIARLADAIDLVSPFDGGFELRMRFEL